MDKLGYDIKERKRLEQLWFQRMLLQFYFFKFWNNIFQQEKEQKQLDELDDLING